MTSKKQSLIIIELYRRIIAEYVGVMGPIVTLSTENSENKIRYVINFKYKRAKYFLESHLCFFIQ